MAYDGKVVLSTHMDNSGLEKALKKLGATVAAAFSVRAIAQFAKESVDAANELSNALTGLKSILDGQGRDFSSAQAFIRSYTSDGLIPATNAITAYKNLAMRGYDDTQIRRVMVALKDASAFGRQASYSMGEAVQSVTEGLKNENSILVDNAGVTKNVAKMWDEYAKSIGTTASALTQQQKIQAEVNGILEESKYQVGDAAKVTETLSGQFSQMSYKLNELKVAVGNAIAPFVENLLPIINDAIEGLTDFANAFGEVIRMLTGSTATAEDLASVMGNAAAGTGELTGETEKLENAITKAEKAAKKALAPFDEIAKLQTGSGTSGSDGSNGSLTVPDVNASAGLGDILQESSELSGFWTSIVEKGKEFRNDVLGKIDPTAVANLNAAMTALESGWKNLLSTYGGGSGFSLSGIVADVLNFNYLTTAGLVKTGGGALDLVAEYRKYFGSGDASGGTSALSGLFRAPFEDEDVWSAWGEMLSGIGMIYSTFSFDEDLKELFMPITGEITNLYRGLSVDASAALETFRRQYNDIYLDLQKLDWGDAVIDDDAVTDVENRLSNMAALIDAQNEAQQQAAEESIMALVAEGLLSEEDAREKIMELEKTYSEQTAFVERGNARIKEILEKAAKEERKLTDAESRAIRGLMTEMNDKTVAIISQGASDSTAIYEELAANRDAMSSEQLSQTIQYAYAEYDAKVQAADETYNTSVASAKRLYNEMGVIDKDEYDRIVADAQSKKDAQIKEAQEARDKLISTAQEAAGGVADTVDEETGEIRSKFEQMWDGMYEKVSITWKNIWEVIRTWLNKIIGGLNTPVLKLNEWSASIGGKSLFGGLSMPVVDLPAIPKLAQGAVLPPNKPFLSIIGDQTHGTNVEAPLATIQEAVAVVMEDMVKSNIAGQEAIVDVLRDILEAVLGIHIGDDVIGQAVARYNAKMAIIRGGL